MSTLQQEEFAVEILNFFYPNATVTTHDITEELGDLAAEMLAEAYEATSNMHLVPRPTYTPSFIWLAKEGVQAFWRKRGQDEIYESVRKTIALKFKSIYQMEKLGI